MSIDEAVIAIGYLVVFLSKSEIEDDIEAAALWETELRKILKKVCDHTPRTISLLM